MADLIFGTSGWSYKDWVGPFYETSTKMFSHYTRFFNTAEINSTFYRYPSEAMVYGLSRSSPKGFIFSAKLPRLITHEKRLNPEEKVENHLLRFLELLNPLKARGKLGCILIQLPPSFAYEKDLENLKAFFEMIPDGYDFAAEFRNPSWMRRETWKLLTRHNVAYCVVDEPRLPRLVPFVPKATSDLGYFRFHGRNTNWFNVPTSERYDYLYTEQELKEFVAPVEDIAEKTRKTYVFFNNCHNGQAAQNAQMMKKMLKLIDEYGPQQRSIFGS